MQRSLSVPSGDCGSLCAGSTFSGRDVSFPMSTEVEIWKPVFGYSDVFASSFGRIHRPLTRKSNDRFSFGCRTKRGYCQIKVNDEIVSVHRLVALAFHNNTDLLPQVNHKDGVKWNNRPDNLEWCTGSHNMQHAHDAKLIVAQRGEDRPLSKLKESDVVEIYREAKTNKTHQSVLAERFGVSQSVISNIISRKRWRHVPV
jgi:hypothetical protein